MTGGAVPQFSQLPLSSMENLTQDFLSKLTISTCTRKSRVYGSCKDIFGNAHNVLPVGTAFFKMISGKKEGETTESASSSSTNYESRIEIPMGMNPNNIEKYTLYDVLGLGNWADCADLDVIKKAYHKAVLLYHPDKQQFKTGSEEEDRSVFLKIQLAYNTLCSEDKRRAYDSQLPFDESIPSDEQVQKALEKGPDRYLRMYDKVFKRNARFAVIKPVPEIGTMETPIEQVNSFYEYWTNFESWRDFTGVGAEYDPDQASDRWEKRSIMKENEKLAKKMKQKEIQRIISLVTRARQKDPRILMDKEAKRLAKEQKQREKEEEKRNKELQEQQEKEAREQAEKEQAKNSRAEKERLRKQESRIRSAFKKVMRALADRCDAVTFTQFPYKKVSEYGVFSYQDVEQTICGSGCMEEIQAVTEFLGGEAGVKEQAMTSWDESTILRGIERVQSLIEFCRTNASAGGNASAGASAPNSPITAASALTTKSALGDSQTPVERQWKREDLSTLSKCIKKFPAGVANRWMCIATEMNTLLKPKQPYQMDECLNVAHNIVKMMAQIK